MHGICSVFILSDHLRFSSFLPVEFEEKVRLLRAPKHQFKPQRTLSDHTSIKGREECVGGVVQHASFNPKTILSGTGAGPGKKPSATPQCNPFK